MTVKILKGDCREVLRTLPDESAHCVVTSPPYFGLRDYGVDGQIGLEKTPDAFVAEIVGVFRDVRRVLRSDGTVWLNLGDSYAGSWGNYGGQNRGKGNSQRQIIKGSAVENPAYEGLEGWRPPTSNKIDGTKPKDLIGVPWLVAFALRADGWYLRQDIIWSKPNPMPESVRDRCTKAHEYIFLLSKSERYYYDQDAIAEASERAGDIPGGGRPATNAKEPRAAFYRPENSTKPVADNRNKRSVWSVATSPFSEAHFATFPPALIEPCIKAGCPEGGTVLDPFGGAGTTGLVADRLNRNAILIELNPEYAAMAERRIKDDAGMFAALT